MTIDQQISQTIETAKAYAVTKGLLIITNENNGLDQCCPQEELNLYTIWIEMLQDYYNKRYLGVAYPGWQYLTEAQALLLMARINSKDFKQQVGIEVSVDGAFDPSYDDSFDVGD